jgi:DNA-binding transcriptional LysR family regulator
MQTNSLRYFLTVVRCGSIAAASTRLNVAASAISRQISNLENELGCVLFERRPRGMAASPAGELLAQHANHILMRADMAASEILELQGTARGLIRIATSEGFALDVLPETMGAFHSRFPGIRFELAVMPPLKVTQSVASGEADLGMTFAMPREPDMTIVYKTTVAMVGLCANGHPLAGKTPVSLRALREYPIVLMPEDTTSRQVFDTACRDEGLSIEPVMASNALSSILSFVKLTNAVAPLANLSVMGPVVRGELSMFPLAELARTSRAVKVHIMRDRQLPHAVQMFLDELISALPAASGSVSSGVR